MQDKVQATKQATSKSKMLEVEKTQHFLTGHGIKWQFSAERAPWRGGFYERLIGLKRYWVRHH